MSTVIFACNLIKSEPSQFSHFWEHSIGSGHATLALRADWQQQITRCKKELGFQHVRFHGILSDDMGTLVNQNDITPPKNYTQWGNLIFTLVEHLKERYGAAELKEWFFEIWNEPNLQAFWTGSQADYFKL